MIHSDKMQNGMIVIHRLIIIARKMAYEEVSHIEIANLLDDIELLPEYLKSPDDKTVEFREHLVMIANKYERQGLLETYDN